MTLTEVWAPVPGYEGRYDVSADGTVVRIQGSPGATAGRVLKPSVERTGYHQVRLYSGGRDSGKWHKVHRLVAAAFIGPCPDGYQVNHKDADKGNNALENLEYVTPRQNIRHAERLGLRPKRRGEKHPMARLSRADVQAIRRLAATTPKVVIAAKFGISAGHVTRITSHAAWRHLEQ